MRQNQVWQCTETQFVLEIMTLVSSENSMGNDDVDAKSCA